MGFRQRENRSSVLMNVQRVLSSSLSGSAAALLRRSSSPSSVVCVAGASGAGGEDRFSNLSAWSAKRAATTLEPQRWSQQDTMEAYISSLRGYQLAMPIDTWNLDQPPNAELKWPRSTR